MKKNFFLAVALFFIVFKINAQVTISATHQMPVLGDSTRYIIADAGGFDMNGVGTADAKVWNYSALIDNGTVDIVYVDPATLQPSAGADLFPTATLARKETGAAGYFYYHNSLNDINRIGFYESASNYIILTGSTVATEFHFPITYGDNYSSLYHGIYAPIVGDSVTVEDGTITISADMQGQLIIPTGIFNNVLRLHVIESFHIKIYLDGTLADDYFISDDYYYWFVDAILQPLVSYGIRTADGTAQAPVLRYQPISQPSVTTLSISGISSSAATGGGNVTSDGGASVTSRGICWSTSTNPTTAGSHTTEGSGIGNFSSSLTSLSASTTYYVRAYATNSVGTAYGQQETFTTQSSAGQPSVSTTTITGVTTNAATSGGNVTSDGGSSITARGVCWSTSPSPIISGNHTTDGSGIGSFTSSIISLSAGTTYYVRAYATNSVGTAYGNEVSFITSSGTTQPSVTTNSTASITTNSATSGGNVTSDGGSSVTARGVCWSTSTNPIISGNHTTDGSGVGPFISNITSLSSNTTYYVRAYATNGIGTSYGNEITFITSSSAGMPVVVTNNVTNATSSSALCGGNVTSDGGSSVTARGICWSTSSNPTVSGSHTTDGTGNGIFSSTLTGLSSSTTYFVKAYATNSQGTAYGNEISFITPLTTSTEVYLTNIAFISLQQDATQTNVPATMSMNNTNPENYVNPGYKVRFKMECFNHKTDGSSIVSGLCKIRTTDPYLQLIDSTSGLNNVGWNQTAWSTDEFEVQINGTTPSGHVCYVNFVVIENTNQWKTYNIPLPVAPLILDSRTIDDDNNPDSNGDNDGLCETGEVIESLPLLKNVSPLNASYNYGEFINYLNYPEIAIWDNQEGTSGTVVNKSYWNYLFGSPQIINAGATGMSPQYDFVFNYNLPQLYHFYLALKMSGKFELFVGNQCYVKWLVQIDYNFGLPEAPIGIEEITFNKNLKVYPNPFSDELIIEIEGNNKNVAFEILNSIGQIIYKGNLLEKTIVQTNIFSSGVYLIKLEDGKNLEFKKIIKE